MSTLATYPYLVGNLVTLAAVAAYCARTRWRAHARCAVLAGAMAIPCAPLAVIHQPGYWSPVRVMPWPWGIEDVVFTAGVGALAWLLAAWPWRQRLPGQAAAGAVWRGASVLAVGVVLTAVLQWGGIGGLVNTLVAAFLLWLALAIWRPALLRLAVGGVLLFTPVYLAVVAVHLWAWPDYILQWNATNPIARPMLGLPTGELLWALAFGAAWPAAVAVVVGWTPDDEPRDRCCTGATQR